jgi:acetyl esterase/lipase
VCCSYRGYWTSKGRPSEKGIALDAAAALQWIEEENARQVAALPGQGDQISLVIWGQSIGAGVATNLAAQQALFSKNVAVKTLILETPFLSIKAMLETLYPQKWLPYRYLGPFLRNHLDSWKALGIMQETAKKLHLIPPNVLILEAGKDELVPNAHGDILEKRCIDLGLEVEKRVIHGALHTEIMARSEGRLAVVAAIQKVAQ